MTTKQLIQILKIKTGMTTTELANACNKNAGRFSEWENGIEMRFSTAFEICESLNIDLWKILKQNQ